MQRALFLAAALVLTACNGGGGNKDGGADTGLPGELLGILVTPETVVLNVGGEANLRATGIFGDRSSMELTHLVDWRSSKTAFVEVSNGLDSEGIITGVAVGETQVTAMLQGVMSVPTNVTVTEADLVGITVSPNPIVAEIGQKIQLVADAAWSDGSRGDAAGQVRWITDDGSVAQIETGGILTAAGAGSTTIHADLGGLSSEDVEVTVLANAAADLVISDLSLEGGVTDFTAVVSVKNRGTAGASDFWVDLFVDPGSAPSAGDLGDRFSHVDYVGPGETVQVTFNQEASAGDHTIWAYADIDGLTDESDTGNNTASGTVNVGSSSGGGPNLVVDYFGYYYYDGTLYYWVDVFNAGGDDSDGFYVDLFYDRSSAPDITETGEQFERVSGLAAGEYEYLSFEVEQECNWCWSWATLDSLEEIDETNEDDNIDGPLSVDTSSSR
jgi:hypothetical protein